MPTTVPPLKITVGNPLKISVTFLDVNTAPFDPSSSIQINVLDPKGIRTVVTLSNGLIRESLGVYSAIIEVSVPGDWLVNGSGMVGNGNLVTTPDFVQYVGPTHIV